MRLVLVDDEKGIVEGLRKMIGRYIPECTIVGTAYNGLDGTEVIEKLKPDIVITDIRMPQADGLDMIKMLKAAGNHTKYILLSGYADFEYARTGIQLGVQFYLNKPVEEQELVDCLHQVMQSIQTDRRKLQEMKQLKQEVHNHIQENALRDILDLGSEQTDLVDELVRFAGIPEEYNRFAALIVEVGGNNCYFKEHGFQPVFRQIHLALRQYKQVYRFRYSGAQIAVIIAHTSTIENGGIIRAVQHLREAFHRETGLSVTVGIGTVQNRAAGISQSFQEARHALSYQVIKGADTVISFPEVMNLAGRFHPVHGEMIERLDAALDNMNEEEGDAVIREVFRGIEANSSLSPADLQRQCLYILLSSIRKISFEQLQQNELLGRQLLSLEEISSFRTLEALEEWMKQIIRGIITFKKQHNAPQKKDIISEIKVYVAEHYNEQISLAELATRFYINPYYLSQIFKQKTGENYLNFLTQTRIGKAKELLENTDLKVYEICRMVGYSDAQHFSRMFEKITGCKPKEYRKNLV